MEVEEGWTTEGPDIKAVIHETIEQAAKEGRLPKRVEREFDVEYGEDAAGSPAAWIWLLINDDGRASEQDAKLLRELNTRIEQAILRKSPGRWPYIAYGQRR